MFISRDLMVQLGLSADFKNQVFQCDGATVPIKEPRGLLGKSYLNSHEMRKVVMQTVKPDSTRKATDIFVKIIDSTYAKADLKQVANNATHLNAEEITQLIRLLKKVEDLSDDTLGDCSTDLANLYLNPGSRPFNSKYYTVSIINKNTILKYLKRLVKIVVLTPVQHS